MSNAVDPYDPLPRSSSQSLADDVASLRLEHVVSASPPPFALKRHKKPSAASSKEERVEMVSRGELPWTVQRTLGFGAFGAVFDATLKDDERVALKICFTTVKTFGVEREIEILAEIARRRPDATPRAAGELVELRALYTFAGACALAMR